MTDERNIAHDKSVAQNKKSRGEAVVEHASIVPQPGKKPALIDPGVAHQMYKNGEEPRVRREGADGNDAMPATRAAWHGVERALPEDADGDAI